MRLADTERRLVQGIDALGDAQDKHAATQMLNLGKGLSPDKRLEVYRNNITSTRVRALQTIYPTVEAILGGDCFAGLARDFAWREADPGADLNRYGAIFSEFLSRQKHRPGFADLPYLPELAQLEWHWHAAHYAADDGAFDHQAFASAADHPGRLHFKLSYSLALMRTRYPVREIHRRHRHRQATDAVPALRDGEHLCIYRRDAEPRIAPVNAASYRLLRQIGQNDSLEQLGEELGDALINALPDAIGRGWVTGFMLEQ